MFVMKIRKFDPFYIECNNLEPFNEAKPKYQNISGLWFVEVYVEENI